MEILRDYPLLHHNTFGIEAKTNLFAEYSSEEELVQVLQTFHKQQFSDDARNGASTPPILHIGAGSNLLFLSDYPGLVLHSAIRGIEVLELDAENALLRVGAGVVWDDLVDWTITHGMYGLENLSLIPGEVGAAAVQNIGAYGVEAKDFITKIDLMNLETAEKRVMTNEELAYAYRYSALKSKDLRGRYAVTYVELKLARHFSPRVNYGGLRDAIAREGLHDEDSLSANILRRVIIQLRQSKLPDPKEWGNAGSFFMNPVVERTKYESLLASYPAMPHYDVDSTHVKIPAGWLIEKAGWRGRALGKAGVYERQALVLVNLGGATGQDITQLSHAVQNDVKSLFDIEIHPEVNFI